MISSLHVSARQKHVILQLQKIYFTVCKARLGLKLKIRAKRRNLLNVSSSSGKESRRNGGLQVLSWYRLKNRKRMIRFNTQLKMD